MTEEEMQARITELEASSKLLRKELSSWRIAYDNAAKAATTWHGSLLVAEARIHELEEQFANAKKKPTRQASRRSGVPARRTARKAS